MIEILQAHWAEVLLAFMLFVKTIINLLPSDAKARNIFGLLDTLVNAIVPDNKSGGGTHKK
tara:strand:- start:232 stop:414 length:183 start_codon:yes stop_codon:yes gene_type:complete